MTSDISSNDDSRFRLLVDAVTDYAIYMLDPTGTIVSWNPGAQRFKGYAEQEILGEHFSRFYTEEDKATDLPRRALATAEREGKFEAEGWRVRKDGTRFWAHVVIDAIRGEDGRLRGFAKITRDLTERREAQRALEKTREAFFQAQKIEAVGQLTGGVAHDFNNLLMAILGSLELVRKRVPEDPRVTRLIDNAYQAAQRGASLTQRMLAFARRQELKLDAVHIPDLVRGMADLLDRSLGPRVTIDTRFPLSINPVLADGNQLELAILNLSMNARDAMPDGGGAITISAREETIGDGHSTGLPPGNYVVVCVGDNGEGMDADTASRATEPFFTTKGVGKGTGLGLSMVEGLAAQSGGKLTIASEKGEGTEISLWLPVAQINREAERTFRRAAIEEEPAATRPIAVLAVDDDALVLLNTAAMLEDLGHIVHQAASAAEALLLLEKHGADLLLTDYAMPQMNGLELVEAARARRPDLPVLLATGFAELGDMAAPQFQRLAKPFTQDELARAVAAAMDPEQAGRVVPLRAR